MVNAFTNARYANQQMKMKPFRFESNIWTGWIIQQYQLNLLISILSDNWKLPPTAAREKILNAKILPNSECDFGLYPEYNGFQTLGEYLGIIGVQNEIQSGS